MIPYYWNGPLHEEICIVTKDSVVGAPKFLVRTIFPHFDTLLCEHCINGHDKIMIIMKDVDTIHVEEAFKALSNNHQTQCMACTLVSNQRLQHLVQPTTATTIKGGI